MHVRRVVALALVIPLLLAGCSEDEPEPKMPDASPSSSEPSPSPTQSETPEAESAEEFIRRWQAAADGMVTSGDSSTFRELSRGCAACTEYASRVEETYADGGSIDFVGSRVESIESESNRPPTFVVRVSSARLTINVPEGEPEVFPPAKQTYRMTLKQVSESWVVRHYAVL